MKQPSQEMINEGYKQVTLNARGRALEHALQARTIGYDGISNVDVVMKNTYSAAELVADAAIIEKYILDGIEPPKVSNIVRAIGVQN